MSYRKSSRSEQFETTKGGIHSLVPRPFLKRLLILDYKCKSERVWWTPPSSLVQPIPKIWGALMSSWLVVNEYTRHKRWRLRPYVTEAMNVDMTYSISSMAIPVTSLVHGIVHFLQASSNSRHMVEFFCHGLIPISWSHKPWCACDLRQKGATTCPL